MTMHGSELSNGVEVLTKLLSERLKDVRPHGSAPCLMLLLTNLRGVNCVNFVRNDYGFSHVFSYVV